MEEQTAIYIGISILVGIALVWGIRARIVKERRIPVDLFNHLQIIGLNVRIMNKGEYVDLQMLGGKLLHSREIISRLEVKERDIEFIDITSERKGQRIYHRIDYCVTTPKLKNQENTQDTTFEYGTEKVQKGAVNTVKWKGDERAVEALQSDESLTNLILSLRPPHTLVSWLQIIPESEYGITRVRTDFFLPSSEQFEVIEGIARHMKEIW